MSLTLFAIFILVFVAGYASSVDAALSSFSPARADELAEREVPGAQRLVKILENPAPYINTNLLFGVIAEISAVVLAVQIVFENLDNWGGTIVVIAIMASVSFVIVGVGPRTIGRQHSERIVLFSAWPLMWATKLLGPIPKLLILVGNAVTPGKGFSEGPFASEAEVRELVDLAEASMVIESDESKMIHRVFELGDTITREVMVPRTDIVYLEKHKTLRQAMSLFLRSGYSRVPIIDENLDDVIGMAYLKDVTKRVYDNRDAEHNERIESVMRSCSFVPDTKPVDDLLREMQAERSHVAIVVDEYGGTAGMVTIEDILEEIVGEITDEYDEATSEIELISEDTWRVSARYAIDDLADLVSGEFASEEVDTVLGLMAKELGKVPIAGTAVDIAGFSFIAQSATGRRKKVETVLVKRLEQEVGLPNGGSELDS